MEKKDLIVAVDMGGTTAKIAFATTEGKILETIVVDTKKDYETIPYFAQEVKNAAKKFGYNWDKQVKAIGFGAVGPLDIKNEISISALKVNWTNFPVKKEVEKHFDKKAYIINDARSIVYGEWKKGAGKGLNSFIIFGIGTGIGGGMVIDGKLWAGAHNGSGEFGHGGKYQNLHPCACKLPGCIEGSSSAIGIERYFQTFIKENPKSSLAKRQKELKKEIKIKDIADLIKAKDKDAIKAFKYPLEPLVNKMASLIFALDPEAVLIGGGPSNLGQVLIDIIKDLLKDVLWKSYHDNVAIKLCKLKNEAGMYGVIEYTIEQMNKKGNNDKNKKQ